MICRPASPAPTPALPRQPSLARLSLVDTHRLGAPRKRSFALLQTPNRELQSPRRRQRLHFCHAQSGHASCRSGTRTGHRSLARVTRVQDHDHVFPCDPALHRTDSRLCNKAGFPVHAPDLPARPILLMSADAVAGRASARSGILRTAHPATLDDLLGEAMAGGRIRR